MSSVISSVAGTRTEPKDSYIFVRNTAATFKVTLMSNGVPTVVDTSTTPFVRIIQPKFLDKINAPAPIVIAEIQGSLVSGQEHEYQFVWNIPITTVPNDEYIVQYWGILGGLELNFGDEYFTVRSSPSTVDILTPYYCTVDDIRMHKFNIDDYLPKVYAQNLQARNNLISRHIRNAGTRLREEVALFQLRGMTEEYRLFAIWYTIWSLMLAARSEDGSSVSSEHIAAYREEYSKILAQIKRHGQMQGLSIGRS